MTTLDKRLNAYRPDLADIKLKGQVEAARFVEGTRAQIAEPVTPLLRAPDPTAMQLTQAIYGEHLHVFEHAHGYAFIQLEEDGYVGYVPITALQGEVTPTTHHVSAVSTHVYGKPDIKSQPAIAIPMNSSLSVVGQEGQFVELASGEFVFAAHVSDKRETDFVAVAERFLNVPYLWGGKSFAGIDCSGLVQASLHACGIPCLRDSDMQEKSLGVPASLDHLQRGDFIFWKGHVGIMRDATHLLHANGHHMMTVIEPVQDAITRIKSKGGGEVTAVRRLT
jgi:cell wall-associated NlpC family hydrolase